MFRDATTLEDIYRLALPQGTQILFGEELLNRPVSWACSLRPSPPAFPNLAGDELALIDMDDLRQLDARMRLDRVVESLRKARVAAIAVRGEVSPSAVAAAHHNRIPLLALSAAEPLMAVERTVIRLIVDRSGYIAARAAELQRELTQIALDGGGLEAMAQRLHQFSAQPVLFLGKDGALIVSAGLGHLSARQRRRLMAALPNVTALRSWVASQGRPDFSAGLLALSHRGPESGYDRAVVAPVITGEHIDGYCLVLRPTAVGPSTISTVESLTIQQGTGAVALEWSRQHAVGAVQERMRAAFLDELLAAEIADEQAWIQRGRSLGYDLTQPYTAWIIEATGIPDWPTPLLHFLGDRGDTIPISDRPEGTLLFWPTDNPKSGRGFKAVAAALVEQIGSAYPQGSLVIGIGRPGPSPRAWLHSLEQARESWRMGKSWQAEPVTYFGDLGLYKLLTALSGNREAVSFFRKTIQPLIEHDRNRNADLVNTLEVFFACHGKLSQTAAMLHIHRNTLAYRLNRISAITRLDLDDPDARFSLQLGLKLRPVLKQRP